MPVIDEDGRIFGVVNVIDALVVLLALAVVAAGVALVVGDSSQEQATRNATVSVGTVQPYVAGLVQTGRVRTLGTNATVTDVYRSPVPNGTVSLMLRVQFEGKTTDRGFAVKGTIIRHGTELTFETPQYALAGKVATVGGDDTLDTRDARVTVEANVTEAVADAISAGDTQRIAGDEVAQVTAVESVQGTGEYRTVRVRLRVTARSLGDTLYYGDSPLRMGSRLRFATSRYEFQGTVTNVTS